MSNTNEKVESFKEKIDLATRCWSEQQDIIKFADSKANFNLVICTALFASFGIGSGTIGSTIKNAVLPTQLFIIPFGIVSFFSIIFSFIFSLWVVLPRFSNYKSDYSPKPIPYFRYIAEEIKNVKILEEELNKFSPQDLLKVRINQTFQLAKIANTKMVWTSRSVKLTIASVCLSSIFFIIIVVAIVIN